MKTSSSKELKSDYRTTKISIGYINVKHTCKITRIECYSHQEQL